MASLPFTPPRIIAAAVALVAAIFICSAHPQDEPTLLGYGVDDLVALYVELALSEETGVDNLANVLLHKWPPAATVRIIPQPSSTLVNQHGADLFVDEIGRVSEFLASVVEYPSIVSFTKPELEEYAVEYRDSGVAPFAANYVAAYVGTRDELFAKMRTLDEQSGGAFPRSFLEKLPAIREPICAGWTTRRGETDWHLSKGFLFIEYSDRFSACLYEEIMQAFGIPNDFASGTPSIFNDDNAYDEPTELDLLLWRVHSDPRIVAGMNEDDVRAIAPQIITQLLSPE